MGRIRPRQHEHLPEMKAYRVQLTKGKYALVDEEDFARVSQYAWYTQGIAGRQYAACDLGSTANRTRLYMHRVISNAPKGVQIDHVNGNSLDNRKANLRYASKATNMRNRGKLNRKGGSSSQYKGVYHDRRYANSWNAYITVDGKRINLGTFSTEDQAARVYDEAAKKYHGEFAFLNFGKGIENNQEFTR